MNNKILILISISFLAAISALSYLYIKSTHKIAFVKTQYLIDNYEGMKEARIKFKTKMEPLERHLDSLKMNYTLLVGGVTDNRNISKELTGTIIKSQNEIKGMQEYYEELNGKEDELMTSQVLTQVNSYINDFGELRGYEVILGTTSSGNVLYGQKDIDITEDVLHFINDKYKGTK